MSALAIILVIVGCLVVLGAIGCFVFLRMRSNRPHEGPLGSKHEGSFDYNYDDHKSPTKPMGEPFELSTSSFNAKATVLNPSQHQHYHPSQPSAVYSQQQSTSHLQFDNETPQSQIVMMVPKSTPSSPPFNSHSEMTRQSSDLLASNEMLPIPNHSPVRSHAPRSHNHSNHSHNQPHANQVSLSVSSDSMDDSHLKADVGSYGASYAESYGVGGESYSQSYDQSMLDRDTMGSVAFDNDNDEDDVAHTTNHPTTAAGLDRKDSHWMEAMDEMRDTNDSYAMLEANSFGSARGSAMRFSTDSDFH